jgi:hypothetical protein
MRRKRDETGRCALFAQRCLVLGAALVAGLSAASLTAAASPVKAHRATATERLLLGQALFDYRFATNPSISRETILSPSVVPLGHPGAIGSRSVDAYAVIGVKGWDSTGQFVGYETAFAVHYSAPLVGWHFFTDGTAAQTGCETKWYPFGTESAITQALGLKC